MKKCKEQTITIEIPNKDFKYLDEKDAWEIHKLILELINNKKKKGGDQ